MTIRRAIRPLGGGIRDPYKKETVLFESSTPGTYNLNISGDGVYLVYCIGGGGGSARSYSPSKKKAAKAGGGSGSGFIGEIHISSGDYSIVVGNGGNAAYTGGGWSYGAAGGNSSLSNIITCFGGRGGAADAGGPSYIVGAGGSAPAIIGQTKNIELNSSGNSGGNGPGGASLYNGYGTGGTAIHDHPFSSAGSQNPGTAGYVKIVYKRLK